MRAFFAALRICLMLRIIPTTSLLDYLLIRLQEGSLALDLEGDRLFDSFEWVQILDFCLCAEHAVERSSWNEGEFVLADLVAFRDVRIKIIFTIPLREVGKIAIDRQAYQENVLDRLLVQDWKRARMAETNGTNIHIRLFLIGIILAGAKHLRLCLEFGMDL